jgi:hypothetical protein
MFSCERAADGRQCDDGMMMMMIVVVVMVMRMVMIVVSLEPDVDVHRVKLARHVLLRKGIGRSSGLPIPGMEAQCLLYAAPSD